jgi:hypothetical protein
MPTKQWTHPTIATVMLGISFSFVSPLAAQQTNGTPAPSLDELEKQLENQKLNKQQEGEKNKSSSGVHSAAKSSSIVGTLSLTVTPSGAKVFVDDAYTGLAFDHSASRFVALDLAELSRPVASSQSTVFPSHRDWVCRYWTPQSCSAVLQQKL